MAENKTRATAESVAAFLDTVEPAERRQDAQAVCALFETATGEPAAMWGPSIVGFGRYRYRYDSGREGEMARVSFSPRKAELVLYGLLSTPGAEAMLTRLGKHKIGKGCLYVKRWSDIDQDVLTALARKAVETRKPDEIG